MEVQVGVASECGRFRVARTLLSASYVQQDGLQGVHKFLVI